ncbi:LOW QUALITY PROTEIN: sex peptide receptor-like [Pollicipes pollicipes]|uniref:LOW QUALITY PROTEIN: sex peptide receptor-like n=1 Tax=Pollicipes pollicipes TaxID=41117 RepID=UPI001884E453|nr:LOW QUALITY PROTEIN: sex peptide receptor-like [Pollicipes pollicipes]
MLQQYKPLASTTNDHTHFHANVTHQTPLDYALPLYGYVMPVLLAVTIVANTLIVVVMSRHHMRTPTNLVLMAMAVSDMLTLLLPAPWMLYMYTFGNYRKPLDSIYACYMYVTMTDTLPSLFHTSSIWLTLALAVQRYVYVCHQAAARAWCTEPRVSRAIAWIYLLALLHQASRFFDRSFDVLEVIYAGRVTPSCSIGLPHWVTHAVTENVYFGFYFGFRLLFIHLLPCVSLVVFNILLFRTLQAAQAKRLQLFRNSSSNGKRDCRTAMDSNCTTMMLIVVVSAFLIVEIPLAVVTCLHIVQNLMGNTELLDYNISQALVVVINFIISLSYPINFAIYCGMSRQFRETFRDLFITGKMAHFSISGSGRYSTTNGPRTDTML